MMVPPFRHLRQQVAFVCIRAYAAHCYIYYCCDENIIDDHAFDALWKFIRENYDWIKPYDVNNYLPEKEQDTSSGFDIAKRICGLTRVYAFELLEAYRNKKEDFICDRYAKDEPDEKPIRRKNKKEKVEEDADFDLIG